MTTHQSISHWGLFEEVEEEDDAPIYLSHKDRMILQRQYNAYMTKLVESLAFNSGPFA